MGVKQRIAPSTNNTNNSDKALIKYQIMMDPPIVGQKTTTDKMENALKKEAPANTKQTPSVCRR